MTTLKSLGSFSGWRYCSHLIVPNKALLTLITNGTFVHFFIIAIGSWISLYICSISFEQVIWCSFLEIWWWTWSRLLRETKSNFPVRIDRRFWSLVFNRCRHIDNVYTRRHNSRSALRNDASAINSTFSEIKSISQLYETVQSIILSQTSKWHIIVPSCKKYLLLYYTSKMTVVPFKVDS